jgi:hypothetical protein
MSDIAKMDIFFIVTTIAVVVVTVLLSIALYRIVKILRNVERVSKLVSDEGEAVRGDIADMRGAIKAEGFKWGHLARFARKRAASFMGAKEEKRS